MKIRTRFNKSLFAAIFVFNMGLSMREALAVDGLLTAFADVRIENVPRGVDFPVRGPSAPGLLLKNIGDAPIHVHVEILMPAPQDLRGGALPIPDVGWLKVVPNRFEIAAHGQQLCQLTLRVPSKLKYRKMYYQVTLWSHTEPAIGRRMTVNAGLLSRLRFKTR